MFKWAGGKLTKDYTEVPLFWVDFNLVKYEKCGPENSCIVRLHPVLAGDKYIYDTLGEIIDHIRNSYDMEKISKL